jgi:streptomycin 6-kinase
MEGSRLQGSLGEKIGEGASADVHVWAPGQVVKLFKQTSSPRLRQDEARMTRAVFAAGAPAAEMLGEVTVNDCFGIVLSHLDGPTLLQQMRSGAVTRQRAGKLLAALCLWVHNTRPPPRMLSLRTWVEAWMEDGARLLPAHIAAVIRALNERLPPGDALCHGDIHPGNVILTRDGPRLIDWMGPVHGPAAYDLAVTHLALTELADEPERSRAANAALQAEYARLTGTSPAALSAAIEPYLPIVRVWAVIGGVLPQAHERLLQRTEAACAPSVAISSYFRRALGSALASS